MKQQLKAAILLVFTSIILFGCASTRTTGQKLADIEPISRLGIIIQHSTFGTSAFGASPGSYVANKALSDLLPRLPRRTLAVFAANDIESKMILGRSSGLQPVSADIAQLQGYQYLLVILPTSATYQSYGGHVSIEMRAAIVDRTNNKNVWSGAIMFHKAGLAEIDDSVADQFSKELLVQLNKNGVIRLKNAEASLPKS